MNAFSYNPYKKTKHVLILNINGDWKQVSLGSDFFFFLGQNLHVPFKSHDIGIKFSNQSGILKNAKNEVTKLMHTKSILERRGFRYLITSKQNDIK